MPNAVALFARVMADVFAGKPASVQSQPSHETPVQQTTPAAPVEKPTSTDGSSLTAHVVGQGASNETVVTIGDIPYLFIDEGDHVVQFGPAFDDHAEETEFGLKILPDLIPHWAKRAVHRCPLKDAVAAAIRQNGKSPPANPLPQSSKEAEGGAPDSSGGSEEAFGPEHAAAAPSRRMQSADASNVAGRIVSWGEERFPDRKKPGRFYKSFAMHIDTSAGERTLQGEGLKEAIAECRCTIGDVVSVRRTGKVKVPAIRTDGSPIVKDGKPVMWDKWLWSISK
jgi:hypothetical protein